MMKGFSPIVVNYKNETREIAADQFLLALAQVEEVLTFPELNEILIAAQQAKRFKVAKLSQGFAELLQFAGFDVELSALVKAIMQGDEANNAFDALVSLFSQLMSNVENEDGTAKKPKAPCNRQTVTRKNS